MHGRDMLLEYALIEFDSLDFDLLTEELGETTLFTLHESWLIDIEISWMIDILEAPMNLKGNPNRARNHTSVEYT